MAIDPYTSDDYAAFLVYAGPPPTYTYPNRRRAAASDLKRRLAYIGECDKFCLEYFDPPDTDREEWVEFYQAFTRWFNIWQGMANEIEGDGKALHRSKQDT